MTTSNGFITVPIAHIIFDTDASLNKRISVSFITVMALVAIALIVMALLTI